MTQNRRRAASNNNAHGKTIHSNINFINIAIMTTNNIKSVHAEVSRYNPLIKLSP